MFIELLKNESNLNEVKVIRTTRFGEWTLLLFIVIINYEGVQGWRSGESTRLPPMWPGFDSQIRRHMWVEFVGSLLCTERFSPGTPVSPLL